MSHELHIRVKDNDLDPRYIYVTDFSLYDPLMPVRDRTLRVQLPGFDVPVELLSTMNGTNSYTNRNFGVATGRDPGAIADGLFTFTYSVNPNVRIFTVLYHYRTTLLSARLYSAMSEIYRQSILNTTITGDQQLEKNIIYLLRAQMMLAGMKLPITNNGQLKSLNTQYREIDTIIDSVTKTFC